MKKILIIASLALCCSLLASCEDFLDTKKYGAKTDWETQEDVEKALVALFSPAAASRGSNAAATT